MTYKETLRCIENSAAVLDIYLKNTDAISVRPLEAMFLHKKLITNNMEIRNLDYYNPHNIFIIGYDDINNIANFLHTPTETLDERIANKYEFESWLERFDK